MDRQKNPSPGEYSYKEIQSRLNNGQMSLEELRDIIDKRNNQIDELDRLYGPYGPSGDGKSILPAKWSLEGFMNTLPIVILRLKEHPEIKSVYSIKFGTGEIVHVGGSVIRVKFHIYDQNGRMMKNIIDKELKQTLFPSEDNLDWNTI